MSDFPALLASEMGVARRTVTRWCAAGKVPGAYRTKGGHWRLRKPRRETCWGRYDDKIVEFVVRYTRVPGDPLSVRQAAQLNKIVLWLDENKLAAVAASILRRLVIRSEDNRPVSIDWQFAEEMEKLIDSKDFKAAFECSFVLAQISEDDKLPRHFEKIPFQEKRRVLQQHFEDLKNRDPKKYHFLTERDLRKIMHRRAYEGTATGVRLLMIYAEKLRLNMRHVTAKNLSHELRISPATLYRRYGREAVRRACRQVPTHDESPASVRHQLR